MINAKKIVSAIVFTLSLVFLSARPSQAQVLIPYTTATTADAFVITTVAAASTTDFTAAPAKRNSKKDKSTFIIYAGPNFSTLSVESDQLDHQTEAGFHIGASWRSKGFFYGQTGLRYNNPVYSVFPAVGIDTGDHKFAVTDIDIPITGGINILSATDRVLGLRIFLSAVPAFNLSVGDNDEGIVKDSINTFIFYGQGGIGVDVLFLVIEAGFNYGFTDLLKNFDSKPGQVFVNLGFRF